MVGLSVMKAILGLVVLAVVTGCSSSDGESAAGLDGVWQTGLPNGCALTYAFDGATWTDNLVCQLVNGNYGMEIESGVVNRASNTLDLTPQQSSCPAHSFATSAGYDVKGDQLVLRFSNATLVLKRTKQTTAQGGALIGNGCWDFSVNPGQFTAGPVVRL